MSSAHATPLDDPGAYDPVPVHVTFSDWTPGICSTLGMIIVNLIDKQQLLSEDGDGGGSWGEGSWGGGVAWRARLFLFLGFALMAGGMAGSVVSPTLAGLTVYAGAPRCAAGVPGGAFFSAEADGLSLSPRQQTVLVIKYVLPPYPGSFGVEWGIANVIQSSTSRPSAAQPEHRIDRPLLRRRTLKLISLPARSHHHAQCYRPMGGTVLGERLRVQPHAIVAVLISSL